MHSAAQVQFGTYSSMYPQRQPGMRIIESSIVQRILGRLSASTGTSKTRIFFNCAKAECELPPPCVAWFAAGLRGRVQLIRLPSTSPAKASIPMAVKLRDWQPIAGWPRTSFAARITLRLSPFRAGWRQLCHTLQLKWRLGLRLCWHTVASPCFEPRMSAKPLLKN